MQLFIDDILLLLGIVFFYILFLFQRELNVNKLIHIVLIYCLGF